MKKEKGYVGQEFFFLGALDSLIISLFSFMRGDDMEIIYEGLLREVPAIIMLLLIGIRVLFILLTKQRRTWGGELFDKRGPKVRREC